MEDNIKIRSIRCSDAVINTLRKMCDENLADNQAEALNQMMEAWEYVQSISAPSLKDQQVRIKSFRTHMGVVEEMFLSVLKDMETVDETIESKYHELIESTSSRVLDLERQLKTSDSSLSRLKEELTKTLAEKQQYEQEFREMKAEQAASIKRREAIISDKDMLIHSLSDELERLKKIASENEVEALKDKCNSLLAQNEELKSSLTKLKAEADLREETALAKQEAELTRKFVAEIAEIRKNLLK